ncbi:hypothetical protein L1887_62958 [Cichorium endivia]|nr:hypothetical protein L1887_62958 [Cichorium endivia]
MEWQQSIVDSGTRSGGKVEPVEPPPPTPPSAATLSNTCTEHAAAKGSDARTALSAPNSTAALPTKKSSGQKKLAAFAQHPLTTHTPPRAPCCFAAFSSSSFFAEPRR